MRWKGLKVRGNSTEGQEARRFRGHGQHRQVTRCEREMQTCSNQCQPAEFWANLHNRGGVLHRQIRRTMCHPTRRKKALSLTLSENTSKGDGAFSCIFQSHLADSRTGFTRSVCSYPPIPI